MALFARVIVDGNTTLYDLRKFLEIARGLPGETIIGQEDENGFYDLQLELTTPPHQEGNEPCPASDR